jgi:hypothetical protein
MTDARLPCHWLHDPTLENLSDRAWRTYTGSLMWCAEHGTDGRIPMRSLRLLHPDGVDRDTAAALVTAGLWKHVHDGYEIPDWDAHQSLAVDVEWQRQRNRRKVADYRARERAKAARPEGVTGYVTGYVTDYSGGEARRGEEEQNHAGTNARAREETA